VASRVCPKCNAQVSAPIVAAYSEGMECPSCHTRLEVNSAARMIAAWAGLAAGYIAWRLTRGGEGELAAVLPALYALLAFGVVSAVTAMVAGDLRIAPELPPVEAAPAAHGHGGGHDAHGHDAHGGGHH
jgi:hypothetical protein